MAVPTGSSSLQSNSLFETLLSGAMIVAALAFLVFMRVETGTGRLESYEVTVELANAGTLKAGTDVRIAGVKVGTVIGLALDRTHYYAVLRIALRDDLKLPADSRFSVANPVAGEAFLLVSPGHGAASVPPGGAFPLTRKSSLAAGV